MVINTGLEIESLIQGANRAMQGLIATWYISSLIPLMTCLFQLVTILALNDVPTVEGRFIIAAFCTFTSFMYLTRLYILMNSGQTLGNWIKRSKRALDDIIMSQDATPSKIKDSQNGYQLFVLRKRLEVYQLIFPITPYSVFSLSNRTFCATLATIVGYIVVFIKFRGMETSSSQSVLNGSNETVP